MKVAQLWRYPVKSFQGERLAEVDMSALGMQGDRRLGVVDASGEGAQVLSAKREARLLEAAARTVEGGVEVRLPSGQWQAAGSPDLDRALTEWLGRPVRLASSDPSTPRSFSMHVDATDDSSPAVDIPCPPGTFVDAAPLHLLTMASLATMSGLAPASAWHVARFRPGVLVEVEEEGFAEDAWIGATVHIGEVEASVFAPTVRCAMTTRAQRDLPKDVDVARAVARHHQANLGVYAVVTAGGRVREGDPVVVRS